MLMATEQVKDAVADRSAMALLLHQQSSKDFSDPTYPQQALVPTPAVWPSHDHLDVASEASSTAPVVTGSAVNETADSQAESAPAASASTPAPAQQKASEHHHWCWRHVCPHDKPLAFLAVVVAGILIFVACVWACVVLSGVCLVWCGFCCLSH